MVEEFSQLFSSLPGTWKRSDVRCQKGNRSLQVSQTKDNKKFVSRRVACELSCSPERYSNKGDF
jgi:hypothetical protein